MPPALKCNTVLNRDRLWFCLGSSGGSNEMLWFHRAEQKIKSSVQCRGADAHPENGSVDLHIKATCMSFQKPKFSSVRDHPSLFSTVQELKLLLDGF